MTDLTQLVLANNNLSSMRKRTVAIEVVVGAAGVLALGIVVAIALTFSRQFYRVNEEQRGSPQPEVIEGVLLTSNGIHRLNIDFSVTMEALTNHYNIFLKPQFSTYYKAIMPSGLRYIFAEKGTLFDVLHGGGNGPILLLDLSSKSILLKSSMEPQVGDIELYKVIDPSKSTGSLSTVAGSVGYIPPIHIHERVTMAGNVYSFGVILLELVTGKAVVSEGIDKAEDEERVEDAAKCEVNLMVLE
ncbi:hypothetical protein LguiA_004783 [Lonicera macranthoides]